MALTVTCKGEYKIPDTKDIKCPTIKVEVVATFDDNNPVEQAKHAYYKQNAQKVLDKELQARGKQFIDPIKDAQQKVDNLRNIIQNLEKMQMGNVTKWAKLPELHKQLVNEKKHLEEFLKVAKSSIDQAVRSIQSFEADRWLEAVDTKGHDIAVKKLKSKATWKKVKLGLKVFLVGAVILTTAAVGIAASVVTLNPGPLALAAVIIGAVVSGSSALISVGKLIKKNWMSESKVMKKIGADLAALGKVTDEIKTKRTPQLKKHLLELATYRADRAKAIRDMDAQITDMEKATVDLQKKFNDAVKNNLKGANDRMKTLNEFKSAIKQLKAAKQRLDTEDKAAQKLIKDSQDVLGDYDKLGTETIKGLPTTWDKLRGNLGGGTENTANLLSQTVNLAAGLK